MERVRARALCRWTAAATVAMAAACAADPDGPAARDAPPPSAAPPPHEAAPPAGTPGDRRFPSPSGRRTLVLLHGNEGPLFLLCDRREGAPDAEFARVPSPWEYAPDGPRSVEPGPSDRLRARGLLPAEAEDARVLDDGGAVLLLPPAERADAPVLLRLRPDGTVAWTVPWSALPPETRPPPRGAREGGWRGWWADGERSTVVIVPEGPPLEIPATGGPVVPAPPEALVSRALRGPARERELALEVAFDDPAPAMLAAARALAAQPDAPEGVALRALEVLLRAGEPVTGTAERFRAAALRAGAPEELRAYAVSRLPLLLGRDALPALRAAMGGESDLAWRAALEAMAALGQDAVPALTEMLEEPGGTLDSRGGAAAVLGALRATEALDALWRVALRFDRETDPHDHVPGQALEAILAIAPPGIGFRVVELLAEGSPHDGRIAGFLAAHPHASAAPALVAALERAAPHAWERRPIVRALRACTGRDLGDDPAAWREAIR